MRRDKGYSLLELSLVIGGIGVLLLVAIRYVPMLSIDYKINAEMKNLAAFGKACEGYYGRYGMYPDTVSDLVSVGIFEKRENIFGRQYRLVSTNDHSIVVGMDIPSNIETKGDEIFSHLTPVDSEWNRMNFTVMLTASLVEECRSDNNILLNPELGHI